MPMESIVLLTLATVAYLAHRLGKVPRRGYLEVHPRHAGRLHALGLAGVEDFLALPGVLVGGHPDRNVGRVRLPDGATAAFLKREHRVPWRVRLASWWAGFGWCSRSLREARVLQALEREGFAAPEWLAAGETADGRAFLLLCEVPAARELRAVLPGLSENARRRRVVELARALARLHTCGLVHPDLYAGHVLVEGGTDRLVFIDWARCQRRPVVSLAQRARALAALDATFPAGEATPLERLLALRAYLRAAQPDLRPEQHAAFLRLVDRLRGQFAHRRHVVEKSQRRADTPQTWTTVEGEALCVAAALGEVFPGDPAWLSLRKTAPANASRWLTTPTGEAVRLDRQCHRAGVASWLAWLRGHAYAAPEQRRAHLLLRLERYHVPVPQVLAMGHRWHGSSKLEAFLLTRPPGRTLALALWLKRCPDPDARREVLQAAGGLVRRLHAAGCYLDGPAGWDGVAVQVADGGPRVVLDRVEGLRLRRRYRARLAEAELRECAALLAARGCDEAERAAFVAGYDAGAPDAAATATAAIRHDAGDATMTEPVPLVPTESPRGGLWTRLRRGVARLWQRADWGRYVGLDWVATIMGRPATDRFSAKQGRSTGRMILPPEGDASDGEPLRIYLKRHYRLPWWDRVLAMLWPGGGWSPALRELHHLEKARRLGVPVPEVVAAGEFIGPGLNLQSFLAVRELTGQLALHEAIPLAAKRMTPEAFAAWKRGLIQEMARLCRLLHDRNWYHKDLYLCHFYIDEGHTYAAPEAGWRGRVAMIDLHRLGHHPWTWAVWQMKDLAQLLYSSEVEGVTDRDRLAFWRAYQGPTPRHWWDAWLRWLVVLKWRRYRAHNLRHAARRAEEKRTRVPTSLAAEDRA